MRFLFVHQNFPGQFLHIVRHLVAAGTHEIVFISEPNQNNMRGVRKVIYQMPRGATGHTHGAAQDFDVAMVRAEQVAQTAANLRGLGYVPDIIIGHHGWGELLNLRDVWPGTPLLGYHEFYYHEDGLDVGFDPEFPNDPANLPRIRAKNAVNLLALTGGGHGLTPTTFQWSTYPEWSRPNIAVLPEGVDLDSCRADPAARRRSFELKGVSIRPDERVLSYVARDLEPYRGFHVLMRALPALLRARPDLRVVMVGGDGVSYGARLSEGTWRERMLAEVGREIDPARVHFVGKLDYADYLRLLQRSDAHVYLTYPFVASWSLREALAAACAIVASDTEPVREFVQHGRQGLLVPFHAPASLSDAVLELLENKTLAARLRAGARRHAEKTLGMPAYLAGYDALIARAIASAC